MDVVGAVVGGVVETNSVEYVVLFSALEYNEVFVMSASDKVLSRIVLCRAVST